MTTSAAASSSAPRGVPHPAVWTALIVPFGAISGFTQTGLGFLATKNGLTVDDAAAIIAFGMAPQVFKWMWAPLVDLTLNRRAWYLLSSALCIAGVVAMSAIPLRADTLTMLKWVALLASLGTSFLGMSVEGMIASVTPPDQRGRTGGWLQAGNLGGSGIGGFAGLQLMTHLPSPWMAGVTIGAVFALCALGVFLVPPVPRDDSEESVWQATIGMFRGLIELFTSRSGIFAAILCFAPISTGAAAAVLAQAAVAAYWGVGENSVSWTNGLMSGLVMAFGCFVGGLVCEKVRARNVYAMVGVLMALVAIGMAASPYTRLNFIGFGLTYAFFVGMAYASWTGFILETLGAGGAATKYNIFASLSNTPITYMGVLLAATIHGGQVGVGEMLGIEVIDTYLPAVPAPALGARGMLLFEAGAELIGIAVVLVAAQVLLRAPAPETAQPSGAPA